MYLQGELQRDALHWLLGSLCGLFRIPLDPNLIDQNHPPPTTRATFHEAARALGFKTGSRAVAGIDWTKLPYPAIAFLNDTAPTLPSESSLPRRTPESSPAAEQEPGISSTDEAEAPPATPILLLKTDGRQLLYFRPGRQTPETMPVTEAGQRCSPDLILVAKETSTGNEEAIPGFDIEKKSFGFSWFLPELKKHKTIWRDVFLASLAIQLVGLVTPLFTQVLLDKVIPHQTHSTLVVLGVALVMFMLFTAGMTWLRQYLVLHTGNRIDAVLGSQVLRHLLRLPLPYFEHRPTGTLVARLHGVETIREFVSGAAVTLIVGGDEVSYGAKPKDGPTWRQQLLDELGDALDPSRVHFLGKVPYATFLKVLQVSSAHAYLTYPFVLSWSMLEAMAAGCLVVGSRTAPVQEVIHDGENGLLVDFFRPGEIAERVVAALAEPKAFEALRRNARQMIVDRYDLRRVCLPEQLGLIEGVTSGE